MTVRLEYDDISQYIVEGLEKRGIHVDFESVSLDACDDDGAEIEGAHIYASAEVLTENKCPPAKKETTS